ncbi:MAG: radical SAM family heme chaperone HemW [Paracoccaceae bacterium]|nr:radical SAM family heme chaperone HemW [Paracoccaceae bacterium]
MRPDTQDAGFGIYIHWPFCQSKCPYCDFNSHVAAHIDHRAWARAYTRALTHYAQETGDRVVNSIFFGGGTPSLMEPEIVETVLWCIVENWKIDRDVEITLEANPSSVEAGRFADYRAAGVNRVSLGVQALNDTDLRALGRLHSAQEALQSIDIAEKNFPRVSFDLIYARQDQTIANWRQELAFALSLGTEHLSLYQLTIEDGTAFGKRHAAGNLRGLPDDDLSADLYEVTQILCEEANLPPYEVSNHAKPWAQSRHNLIYWRGGDFIGIGPGAHGRLTLSGTRYATETPRDPQEWLAKTLKSCGESQRTALPPHEVALEYLMMSLRLAEGTDLERLSALGFQLDHKKVSDLQDLGLVSMSNSTIRATTNGRMVLNSILRELLAV